MDNIEVDDIDDGNINVDILVNSGLVLKGLYGENGIHGGLYVTFCHT